jgi:hypothetical protein
MSTSRTREKADGELFKSTGIDDNATSTAVTIDASENVGIGESAPAQRLEVNELSQTAFTGIRVNNPNGNVGSAGIEFQVDGNYSKAAIFQKRGHANGGGDLIFAVDSSTDAANWVEGDEKLRITKAGHAIIGGGVTLGNGQTYAAANTLDDYEEGTWTPTATGSTGTPSVTYGSRLGEYTKVGNKVTAFWFFNISSVQSQGGGTLYLSGLPFTVKANNSQETPAVMAQMGIAASSGTSFARTNPNTTVLFLGYKNTQGGTAFSTAAQMNAGYCIGQITYLVA